MRYTTAIFDLDGTLLDTLEDLTDAVNATMNAFGFPERSLGEVRAFVGNGAAKLIERSLPEGRNTPDFDGILSFYDVYYTAHSLIKTAPYDGVHDVLRELCRRGVKLAVVSNKQDAAVKKLVRRFFGDVVSVAIGESAGVRRKPSPDSVLAAMAELMSEPEECVYVGDSDVDILTARAAGIPCVSVTWGFRGEDFLRDRGAERLVSEPKELLEII